MSTRPWMPLYVADYLADTAHLSAAESGAYLHLIMHYWQHGGLPADDRSLARIARMTPNQWKNAKVLVKPFFSDGWKHKRIEFELTEAARLSAAGKAGGVASARARREAKGERSADDTGNDQATIVQRSGNDPPTIPQPLHSPSQLQKERKNSEANASDAFASRDIRADLFDSGLKTLAKITGKTPDSCRSLVGRWLKTVDDEAIHVLGAIEDAARNNVADPVAWINRVLQSHRSTKNGQKPTVHDAANDLLHRLRTLDDPGPGGIRDGEGEGAVRRLPSR